MTLGDGVAAVDDVVVDVGDDLENYSIETASISN